MTSTMDSGSGSVIDSDEMSMMLGDGLSVGVPGPNAGPIGGQTTVAKPSARRRACQGAVGDGDQGCGEVMLSRSCCGVAANVCCCQSR